jgi:hypothetical protein
MWQVEYTALSNVCNTYCLQPLCWSYFQVFSCWEWTCSYLQSAHWAFVWCWMLINRKPCDWFQGFSVSPGSLLLYSSVYFASCISLAGGRILELSYHCMQMFKFWHQWVKYRRLYQVTMWEKIIVSFVNMISSAFFKPYLIRICINFVCLYL